jgi:putative ABC transport system permease protein
VLISFAALFVVTVLLASVYPSIILSEFKPITLFRTKPVKKDGITARKAFTVFQFGIAIAFIICGIVMQKQLRFFRRMDTGINRENVVMIPFGKEMGSHIPAFKNDLRTIPGIRDLSIGLHPLYQGYDMMGITPPGANQMILMPTLDVDQHFISLMKLKWKIPPADPFYYKNRNNIVINESAIEKLNLPANPLQAKVDQFTIAGVLKDFNWSSPEYKIVGLFVSVMGSEDSAALWTGKGGCLYAKLSAGAHTAAVIDQVKSEYNKYDAATPFEYYFLDNAFDSLYKAESRLANILTVFTSLSIIIACLGLLGLVTFIAVQKTKEIGVRKVLGASIVSIWNLLSKEYLVLIAIAFLIAAPVAWLLMKNWLQNFAYRTSVDWWIFPATILSTIFIALITVSYQAIKAATANPIKSLRSE